MLAALASIAGSVLWLIYFDKSGAVYAAVEDGRVVGVVYQNPVAEIGDIAVLHSGVHCPVHPYAACAGLVCAIY